MPISAYGVLKGRVLATHLERGEQTPHYQVHVVAQNRHYRCAVNVQSDDRTSLLFLVEDQFTHPITAHLANLPDGFQRVPSAPGGHALDYIRGNLLDPRDMKVAPANVSGPDNDLNDFIDHYVARAVADPIAEIYAFGQHWGPEAHTRDKTFDFLPGNGVHDMHMNQGNDLSHRGEDGVWQDGGLLIHFPTPSRWVAIFLAFQSQAWHTDDTTGHALVAPGPSPTPRPTPAPAPPPDPAPPPAPAPAPPSDTAPTTTDFSVEIIAALVNPVGPAPEHEHVTLLNVTPDPVNLSGWSIADRNKHTFALQGTIGAGQTVQVALPPDVQLGNAGGLISLLNQQGLKVHGVSFTAAQASREGWTIAF